MKVTMKGGVSAVAAAILLLIQLNACGVRAQALTRGEEWLDCFRGGAVFWSGECQCLGDMKCVGKGCTRNIWVPGTCEDEGCKCAGYDKCRDAGAYVDRFGHCQCDGYCKATATVAWGCGCSLTKKADCEVNPQEWYTNWIPGQGGTEGYSCVLDLNANCERAGAVMDPSDGTCHCLGRCEDQSIDSKCTLEKGDSNWVHSTWKPSECTDCKCAPLAITTITVTTRTTTTPTLAPLGQRCGCVGYWKDDATGKQATESDANLCQVGSDDPHNALQCFAPVDPSHQNFNNDLYHGCLTGNHDHLRDCEMKICHEACPPLTDSSSSADKLAFFACDAACKEIKKPPTLGQLCGCAGYFSGATESDANLCQIHNDSTHNPGECFPPVAPGHVAFDDEFYHGCIQTHLMDCEIKICTEACPPLPDSPSSDELAALLACQAACKEIKKPPTLGQLCGCAGYFNDATESDANLCHVSTNNPSHPDECYPPVDPGHQNFNDGLYHGCILAAQTHLTDCEMKICHEACPPPQSSDEMVAFFACEAACKEIKKPTTTSTTTAPISTSSATTETSKATSSATPHTAETVCSACQYRHVESYECTDCPSGKFQSSSSFTGTDCTVHSGCSDNQYIKYKGTSTADTGCATTRECSASEYESKPPAPGQDRECTSIAVCGDNYYITSPATSTSDNVCSVCDGTQASFDGGCATSTTQPTTVTTSTTTVSATATSTPTVSAASTATVAGIDAMTTTNPTASELASDADASGSDPKGMSAGAAAAVALVVIGIAVALAVYARSSLRKNASPAAGGGEDAGGGDDGMSTTNPAYSANPSNGQQLGAHNSTIATNPAFSAPTMPPPLSLLRTAGAAAAATAPHAWDQRGVPEATWKLLLEGTPSGTFVVRSSNVPSATATLTTVNPGGAGCSHARISQLDSSDKVKLQGSQHVHASLEAMVAFYQDPMYFAQPGKPDVPVQLKLPDAAHPAVHPAAGGAAAAAAHGALSSNPTSSSSSTYEQLWFRDGHQNEEDVYVDLYDTVDSGGEALQHIYSRAVDDGDESDYQVLSPYNPLEQLGGIPILSFEAAIEAASKGMGSTAILQHAKDAVAYARAHPHVNTVQHPAAGPEARLAVDDIAVVHLYTMETDFYSRLNQELGGYGEGADHAHTRHFLPIIKLLVRAFAKLPPVRAKLFRGVKLDHSVVLKVADSSGTRRAAVVGDEVEWLQATSCSTKPDVLKTVNFLGEKTAGTVLQIMSVTGVNIQPYSAVPGEDEVVLPPGSRLVLDSITEWKYGVTEVRLRQIVRDQKNLGGGSGGTSSEAAAEATTYAEISEYMQVGDGSQA